MSASTEGRSRTADRLRRLARSARKAADRLPGSPVAGEVVAAAGIYGMANELEKAADMILSPTDSAVPEGEEEAEVYEKLHEAMKKPPPAPSPEGERENVRTFEDSNGGRAEHLLRAVKAAHLAAHEILDGHPPHEDEAAVPYIRVLGQILDLTGDAVAIDEEITATPSPEPSGERDPRDEEAFLRDILGDIELAEDPQHEHPETVLWSVKAVIEQRLGKRFGERDDG